MNEWPLSAKIVVLLLVLLVAVPLAFKLINALFSVLILAALGFVGYKLLIDKR